MTPYYDSDGVTVFCARCEDVIPLLQVRQVKLVHADPPYGQNERTERATAGRIGAKSRLHAGNVLPKDWPRVVGDDKPFDPEIILELKRPLVTWGAHRYAERLPMSPSWIWWDKRAGSTPDDNGDGEMAWSNLGGPPRQFTHLWRGTCRASETGAVHLHPTQKPIALSTYVFERAKLRPGDLVFVPYLGSGPDLPAARAMGLRVIACDVEEWCCRTAVARLGAAPHPEPAAKLGPLFEGL